jgi:6-phosphogluconolactonase (cycloisomerase 2 family)
MPISVTVHLGRVYVLNAGGVNNVTGFRLEQGTLTPLAGSTRGLSAASVGPAQVDFDPTGRFLVVTEKNTNMITHFRVDQATGLLTQPRHTPSAGMTPFGFAFTTDGTLVTSDAAGGAPGASTATSYDLRFEGGLFLISGPVGTTQTAACWVAITHDDRYAFTTNTGSGSVSTFQIASNGSLTLLHAVGGNTGMGSTPIDMALSRTSQFAYVLTPGAGTMQAFEVESNGTLTSIGSQPVPATAVGAAAR